MPVDRSFPILKTEALTKVYGEHTALDHLDLMVHRGEVARMKAEPAAKTGRPRKKSDA